MHEKYYANCEFHQLLYQYAMEYLEQAAENGVGTANALLGRVSALIHYMKFYLLHMTAFIKSGVYIFLYMCRLDCFLPKQLLYTCLPYT